MEGVSGTETQKVENIEIVSTVYRKHPLSANTTRVFHILPAIKPDQSDIISCRLSVISLNSSPPEYRALSYVWGDPSVTRIILVDDQEFEVRINLWNYLLQARKEGCMDPLWVDAVCIDQANLAERSAQVVIMGQVYGKALEARVWLGKGTQRDLRAMQYLAEIDWQEEGKQLESRHGWGLYGEQMESICEVLNLGYWSRLWIMQEYCLGSSVSVQCGHRTVSGAALDNMRDAASDELCWSQTQPLSNTKAYKIIHARWYYIKQSLEPDRHLLASLMRYSLELDCTDLHDLIYGLLSLDRFASKKIVPDYTKSLSQLFAEVTDFFRVTPMTDTDYWIYVRYAVDALKIRLELSGSSEIRQACQSFEEFMRSSLVKLKGWPGQVFQEYIHE